MDHARKMVLIPEENLALLQTQNQRQTGYHTDEAQIQQQPHGIAATLNRLDVEMNEILNSNAYKDEREKWIAYLTVLQRYLHFADSERTDQYLELVKHKNGKPTSSHPENDKETSSCMNDSIIIESIPAKYRSKGKLLLRRLHDTPSEHFTWDSAGVVAIDGKPIQSSNIVDLVNDAMRARKIAKPVGRRAFASFLKSIKTPREFIGNDELWHESRANSTLREEQIYGSSSTDEESGSTSQSGFFTGADNNSPKRRVQSGAGLRNNKKKRVTWANLKL